MQPSDKYDVKTVFDLNQITVRTPLQVKGDASKEFVARLDKYKQHLTSVSLQPVSAVERVVDGLCEKGPDWDVQRNRLKKELKPLVTGILELEKRWFHNVCEAHESAEKHLAENQTLLRRQQELLKSPPPSHATLKSLESQQTLIKKSWSSSRAKWANLDRLDNKIKTAVTRRDEVGNVYGHEYFEGLRRYLRALGFIVAPSYLPPAAVFPSEDWIPLEGTSTKTPEHLARVSDELMVKYHVLGTAYAGMRYRSDVPTDVSGCVCVSWVVTKCVSNKKRMLVPILGMSGSAPKNADVLDAMLGACALPPYKDPANKPFGKEPLKEILHPQSKELQFNQYYDDLMGRANNLAINYRVRELLSLRLPSRQAMLSYAGLSFTAASRDELAKMSDSSTPSPGVARWHSFNCAEPAALAWISSFFVDGQDVHLCCPYEGADDPGALGLKPKETCPWCATVELTYRSLKKVSPEEKDLWSKKFEESMKTGKWDREFTDARLFSALDTDQGRRVDLPRNKPTFDSAYPSAVNNNVAVLRSVFKEVGLLRKSTIREEKSALWQTA
ncbi:MAG: hypothetical protein ABW123_23125 [Cystobacter sp.]